MTVHTNRWKHEVHVEIGDPCYQCGTPMTPASREYPSVGYCPAGYQPHGSHGLCVKCYRRWLANGRRLDEEQLAASFDDVTAQIEAGQ